MNIVTSPYVKKDLFSYTQRDNLFSTYRGVYFFRLGVYT